MTTTTIEKTVIPNGLDTRVLARVLEEGYGPGAWHGADLKAALAEVPAALAFWRPAPGRHNIAEITLHHAYCVRSVRGQLSGTPAETFVLPGEDWFELDDESRLAWSAIRDTVDEEQSRLARIVGDAGGDTAERFDLVLGVTCHAVYHAGQVQLLKRLHAG
jgi:hypothetical protein